MEKTKSGRACPPREENAAPGTKSSPGKPRINVGLHENLIRKGLKNEEAQTLRRILVLLRSKQ
jgi:hypothetical protein